MTIWTFFHIDLISSRCSTLSSIFTLCTTLSLFQDSFFFFKQEKSRRGQMTVIMIYVPFSLCIVEGVPCIAAARKYIFSQKGLHCINLCLHCLQMTCTLKNFKLLLLKKLFGSNTYLMKIPGVPTSFRNKNFNITKKSWNWRVILCKDNFTSFFSCYFFVWRFSKFLFKNFLGHPILGCTVK